MHIHTHYTDCTGIQFPIVFSSVNVVNVYYVAFYLILIRKIIYDSETVQKMHENTTLRREHTNGIFRHRKIACIGMNGGK